MQLTNLTIFSSLSVMLIFHVALMKLNYLADNLSNLLSRYFCIFTGLALSNFDFHFSLLIFKIGVIVLLLE